MAEKRLQLAARTAVRAQIGRRADGLDLVGEQQFGIHPRPAAITVSLGVAFLGCWIAGPLHAQSELPAAAREVLTQFEAEAADLERKTEAEILKCRQRGVAELQKAQDELTRLGKLEEAAAVRTLIRLVERGAPVALPLGTPAVVRKAYRDFEEEVATLYEKAEAEFVMRRDLAAVELKKIQDAFCKEAKLDEAVAVRDRIRTLAEGKVNAQPDPGYIQAQVTDIGKTFYYEVTGIRGHAGYAIYGTDVYLIGSHLATAAVHCGLVNENQKGVVKVTIVPGQEIFPATTRNGVTSNVAGRADVAFRVERLYSFQAKPFVEAFSLKKLSKKKTD